MSLFNEKSADIPTLVTHKGKKYVMFHPSQDTWRNKARKPFGMQRFATWLRQRLGMKRSFMTDVDGLWHHTSQKGQRALLFEFKPVGKYRYPGVPKGQEITFKKFLSIFPGLQCVVVFAPGWDQEMEDFYPADTVIHVVVYRRGERHNTTTTMEEFASAVADWQVGEGWFADGRYLTQEHIEILKKL